MPYDDPEAFEAAQPLEEDPRAGDIGKANRTELEFTLMADTKVYECFFCSQTYTLKDAIEAKVPLEEAKTYCSGVCYTADSDAMEQDKAENSPD